MPELLSFNPFPDPDLRNAYAEAVEKYAKQDGVTGLDIGYKHEGFEVTTRIAIRVHVVEKKPEPALPPADVIPKFIGKLPTDVIEATYRAFPKMEDPFANFVLPPDVAPEVAERWRVIDPLQPGVRVQNPSSNTMGTLGAIVYDTLNGHRECLLSNWHVFMPGDGPERDLISQPSGSSSMPGHVVGRLLDGRKVFGAEGDAAIALLETTRQRRTRQFKAEDIRTARYAQLGEAVKKSGAASAITNGKVDGIGFYYAKLPGSDPVAIDGFRMFKPLNDAEPMGISKRGDSGSLWYTTSDPSGEHLGIGLHFGATRDAVNDYAVACHLPRVLAALNVSLTP